MGEYDYRFNPNHVPAGSAGGGQFAPASGGGGSAAQDKRPAPTNQHPVGMGERGKRVHDLQERLNALGIKPPLKADGIFGPKTLAAVRKFQQSHGLKVDGLVGPKTTAALRLRHTAGPHHGHHHDHHDHHAPAHKAAAHKTSAPPARPAAPANAGKLAALSRTAETPSASTVHEPFGSPSGPGLFHVKGLQLPAYVQHVAHHLAAMGHPESQAIQIAIGVIKDWAAGRTPGGKGHVHPDVQAAASKALAEWEAAKAAAHGKGRARTVPDELRFLDGCWG